MLQSVVPYEEELWTNGSNLLCRNTQSLKRTCESVQTFGYVLRSMKVWSVSFVVLECFLQSQAAVSYAVVFVSDPELPCKGCFQVFDSSTNSPHLLSVLALVASQCSVSKYSFVICRNIFRTQARAAQGMHKPFPQMGFYSSFSSSQWVKLCHLSSRGWEKKLVTKAMFHIKKDSAVEMAPNFQGEDFVLYMVNRGITIQMFLE